MKINLNNPSVANDASRPQGRDALFYVHVVLALIVTIAGCLYTGMAVHTCNRRMRDDLLTRTRVIASAVNADRVKSLSGSASDLNTAPYQRLKSQLYTLKQAYTDIRFIYIMGRTANGDIFFFIDNEATDSPDLVLPGQPYPEASPLFRQGLAQWLEVVDGPINDQWGTWFTALVPMRDPLTGAPLAMLGADIAATTWYQRLLGAALPGAGITLLILLIIGLGCALHGRCRCLHTPASRHQHLIEPGLVALIGVVLSVFTAWRVHVGERCQREQIFNQVAEGFTSLIAKNINLIRFAELEGLASFLQHSPDITREEFHLYAGHLVKNSLVQAWDLIGIVPRDERRAFEEKMHRQGVSDFRIWEYGPDGQKVPAADRPCYYPVVFFAPEAGNETVLGYDLASEPMRLAVVETTLATGLPTATEPLVLIQEWAAQKSILALHPVFAANSQNIRGFALAAIRMESLLGHDPEKFRLAQLSISFMRPDREPELLAQSMIESTCARGTKVMRPLFAFGQVLTISAQPCDDFIAAYPLRKGPIVLFCGIGLSIAVTAIVALLSHRSEELTTLVQKRSAELSRSEERFHQLAEQTHTLHWECDATGLITAVGSECQTIVGYYPEEVIGKMHVFDLYPEAQREQFKEKTLAAFAQKETFNEVINPLITKDGRTIIMSTSCMPIIADNGSLIGYYGSDRDVTERENMTAELEKSRGAAEAASHAKSEFLTNMSHEIRTPINGIVGVADLLRESGLSEEQSEYVDIINTSSQLLLELINEILDFSRIEAGRLTLMPEDFSLERLLEDICSSLALIAHNKNIELYCHIDPHTPLILHGDDFHLRQVLVNLCGNAIKFTEKGEVCISARSDGQRDGKELIRFSVRDTGIGIPDEQQARIFETFSQADSSIKRRYGGTGLGLAIVKRLVELMGGEIKLQSQNGVGSEFYFVIPLTPQPQQSPPPALSDTLRHCQALVVESHRGLRTSLKSRLHNWGILSTPAATLTDALEIMQLGDFQSPFDLVLLDLELLDTRQGNQPLVDLHGSPWTASRIVGMAHVGSPQAASYRYSPALAAFVHKPIKNSDLLKAITLALETQAKPTANTDCPADATPQNHAAAIPETPAAPAAPAAEEEAPAILLVDDNEVNQKVALAIIKKMGMSVDVASNGQQALDLLASNKYRLVLMDVQMPDMDGLQATRLLRSQDETACNRDVPIIAMTAHSAENYQQQCHDAGMNDYICKPITAKTLRECITRWLTGKQQT
ncbi:MAG: response regulator [Lentisphaerae bacterium]|nr:response regulator [Lentisphaerota bacterium]